MIRWYERSAEGIPAKWEYRGRPCRVIAVGIKEGSAKVEFLKVIVDREEIICEPNEAGEFIDLAYGVA